MGKISKIIAALLISLFLIAFFLGIYITVDEKIPDNAVVVVTLEDKLYHSIHFDYICVAGKTAKTMLLSEAKKKGFKLDSHLYQYILSNVGVQYNSRWNTNGDWLW